MKTLGWLLLTLIVLPIVVLGGMFAYGYAHAELTKVDTRLKLTLEIDAPTGVKSGSSVLRLTERDMSQFPLAGLSISQWQRRAEGEAAVVDLGDGRSVIALLTAGPTGGRVDWPVDLHSAILREEAWTVGSAGPLSRQVGATVELPVQWQPTIVTFTDIADPASAKVIYATGRRYSTCAPGQTCQPRDIGPLLIDAFAETFGPGYAFRRATIEMMPKGTPVTRGIEARLPFLVTRREELRRIQSDMPPRFQPHYYKFIRENL